MPASDGLLRAVEAAWEKVESDLELSVVTAVLQIEVASQFNEDRSISLSRVSDLVDGLTSVPSATEEPSNEA